MQPNNTAEALKTYALRVDPDTGQLAGEATGNVSREVDARVRAYLQKNPDMKYSQALNHVLENDAALCDAYTGFSTNHENREVRSYSSQEIFDAGVEVDQEARGYMLRTGEKSYSVAFYAVLNGDVCLREAYEAMPRRPMR